MAGGGVEIERRFLVPIIPEGLDDGEDIVQCYLKPEGVHINDGSLMLDDEMLVEGLSASEQRAVAVLLDSDEQVVVRLRLRGEQAWVTVKGRDLGGIRPEYEWEVPPDRILGTVESGGWPSISKRRHLLPAGDGLMWEVDRFAGDNAGLMIAEIELPTIGTEIELPDWLGQEVTGDPSWSNACLALEPRPQGS